MCTVSWRLLPDGYDLYFSRDEQRTRPDGLPPRAMVVDGTRVLAPHDPLGGGTWILLNEYGLTACVLNGYRPEVQAGGVPVVTRGRVPLAFAREAHAQEAGPALTRLLESAKFLPFHLLLLDRHGRTAGWDWDGRDARRRDVPPLGMMTTSSVDAARVAATREARFRRIVDAQADLRHFHVDADEPASADSVRMSRADARTVSLTEVTVRADYLAMTLAARDGDAGFAGPTSSRLIDAAVSVSA